MINPGGDKVGGQQGSSGGRDRGDSDAFLRTSFCTVLIFESVSILHI